MPLCSLFVEPSKPRFSKSGIPPTRDAHKSDIAISQGIDLMPVPSWVGDNFRPCVPDAHDMVLVAGSLSGMAGALQEPTTKHDNFVSPASSDSSDLSSALGGTVPTRPRPPAQTTYVWSCGILFA